MYSPYENGDREASYEVYDKSAFEVVKEYGPELIHVGVSLVIQVLCAEH
tara:strand:+ start:1597 stop:1743 length:147 start_codon:yes stop_codon:yes gene_type:complete